MRVTTFRDGGQCDQWAGSAGRTLKLLKLAAGTFESAHVLDDLSSSTTPSPFQSQLPSWISEPFDPSVTAAELSSPDPGGQRRRERQRPWREGRSCRLVRWEKAGLAATARRDVSSPTQKESASPRTRRQLLVDIPYRMCPPHTPPGYTTKYFGIVGGALAVMTKVDQLESRRATAPILSQRAPSTAYPHSSEGGDGAEETTANTRRQYRHRRRRWTTEKVSESQNLDIRSQTPVSYVNSSEPHNRASTAVEPPKITPVEGPTPPPWEESKLRAVTHGAVEDNNVGVDDHGDQSTAPSIDSHGTWGSELMALSGVDIQGCESARMVDGKFDFKIVHGRATESIKRGDGADGDQDGQMSPSLSFSSLALEDSSRASMPGESNDERSTEKTVENIASPEMVVRLCGSEREHEHSQPLESEAAAAPVMPGRTTTGKNTTSERKDGTLGCTASRQHKKANTCVLGVFDETQQTLGFGSELPRPQPQLYDIWIPRQYFQGKALTPATRKNENKEVNVPAASARVQKKIRSAIEVASMAVGEAASPNHSDVRESTSRGGSGNVDCGNRHESQDYTQDAGNGDEANSPALERPVPPAVPTTARETCGDKNPHVPWSPSTRSVADGKVEVEVPDKDADLAPSAPSLHLNVALMENEQCVKEKRQGYEFGSDGCSGLGNRDGNGGGGRSASDSAGGGNVRGVGGGIFDFATKFSWRTVANTTSKMMRDGEASRKELNNDETFLAVGASAQNWVTAQQTTSQEKRVVAAKRAKVRCKRAGQAAVERLRAAQSVFNPLHRAPSRPEMRRFITRGHFSPTGRKLWRSSDGLQQWPRTGQICLRAAVPASRIPASHAQHFSPGVSSCSGGSWSYDPEWSSSAMAESLEQGDSQIDECTECCVVESEGEKMASTSCAGACSKLGEGHTPKRCDGGISTTSSDGIHVGDNANGERSHVVRFAKCSTVLRGESNANVPLLCVERNSGGVVSAGDDVIALTTIVGKEACHGETFKEREEPGEMKTKGPAFDGRHNWESVIATDRSTTDGRVEGTDKPWNGCSGAEDTGTPIPSQHPASSPPAVRCQRYCVTIPWSGDDTGECESVESDRISD